MSRHSPSWNCINLANSAVAFGAALLAEPVVRGQEIRFGDPVLYSFGSGGKMHVPLDLDSDGRVDVAVLATSRVHLFLNQGEGTLISAGSIVLPHPGVHMDAGDLDSDGDVDLVWSEYPDQGQYLLRSFLRKWFNDGTGRNGSVSTNELEYSRVRPIHVVDMSEDQRRDILFQSGGSAKLALNVGRGRFAFGEISHTAYVALTYGDLDGDGDMDVTGVHQYIFNYRYVKVSRLDLLKNEGYRRLVHWTSIDLPWQDANLYARAIECGDLDGDGDLDVCMLASDLNRSSPPMQIFFASNDGNNRFALHEPIICPAGKGTGMVLADLNLDGRLDIIYSAADSNVFLIKNLGDLQFGQSVPINVGQAGNLTVSCPDLTGDGVRDLICIGAGAISVLQNLTEISGPDFDHSQLRRGQAAMFVVNGAEPGERVHFLYSPAGEGASRGVTVLGGLTLDLADPLALLGVATADMNGRASVQVRLSMHAPLRTVATQAVIRRGPGGVDSVKTPFRTARIQP